MNKVEKNIEKTESKKVEEIKKAKIVKKKNKKEYYYRHSICKCNF